MEYNMLHVFIMKSKLEQPAWSYQQLDRACLELEHVSGTKPAEEECALVRNVLNSLEMQRNAQRVASIVCAVACRWRDSALWVRAVRKCSPFKGVFTITDDMKLMALELFSFNAIRVG